MCGADREDGAGREWLAPCPSWRRGSACRRCGRCRRGLGGSGREACRRHAAWHSAASAHGSAAAHRAAHRAATCRWCSTSTARSISSPRTAGCGLARMTRRPSPACDAAPEELDVARAIDRFEARRRLAGRGGRTQVGGAPQLRPRPAAGLRFRSASARVSSGSRGRAGSASRPPPLPLASARSSCSASIPTI